MIEQQMLVQAAMEVAQNAHAPYSGYRVGAALSSAGRIHVGCNVENVAYGDTICAERAAVCAMVSAGGTRIEAIAVFTRDQGTPCGSCLQVLSEFAAADLPVWLVGADGSVVARKLSELLPHVFRSENVRNAERHESS